jgi:hypothetical protein
LKDAGLIRTQITCDICRRDMRWCHRPQCTHHFRSECRRRAYTVCIRYKSICHGSWFQQSRLSLQPVTQSTLPTCTTNDRYTTPYRAATTVPCTLLTHPCRSSPPLTFCAGRHIVVFSGQDPHN